MCTFSILCNFLGHAACYAPTKQRAILLLKFETLTHSIISLTISENHHTVTVMTVTKCIIIVIEAEYSSIHLFELSSQISFWTSYINVYMYIHVYRYVHIHASQNTYVYIYIIAERSEASNSAAHALSRCNVFIYIYIIYYLFVRHASLALRMLG